jgi:hypothetical protein|nr:MAG TPA: hypothetical protein [Caudoviricetes sp.]
MKRTYKVLGYRADSKDKNKIDHLLILLRIKWEKKEKAFKNKDFKKAFSSKKEYLRLVRELKKFGISIEEGGLL